MFVHQDLDPQAGPGPWPRDRQAASQPSHAEMLHTDAGRRNSCKQGEAHYRVKSTADDKGLSLGRRFERVKAHQRASMRGLGGS